MLVDTNIIIYAINTDSPKHTASQNFLKEQQKNLTIAHQNVFEAIRVLSHPIFPKPMNLEEVIDDILAIVDSISIIHPDQTTYPLALELIKTYGLAGNRTFDAYLAATALSNGIYTIVTDNVRDFQRIDKLRIINPFK